MTIFNKWSCSWSLTATIVSLVLLFSIVHIFFFPFVPSSLDYIGFRQIQSQCTPNNTSIMGKLNATFDSISVDRFMVDAHGAVTYRNAPWKAAIGKWLLGCDPVTEAIEINENIRGKSCTNGCSGQGVCNQHLGRCRCFHGFGGDGCSERLHFGCNYESSSELPFGRWVVSICPAHCDTTRAMCFCGAGTRYPNRPVAEACGFQFNTYEEHGLPKVINWSRPDFENIFTNDSTRHGWCNVVPEDAYASRVKFKQECDCKYDCTVGRFCEIPTTCSCINQCSGHGHCRGGFCECHGGWYGIDCSTPSVSSAMQNWPLWLRPATVLVPDREHLDVNVKAMVKKKRPLIYVYDLPPEYNSHLLEGRHFKFQCMNRIYDGKNGTIWTEQLYGSQVALLESILASPYRTQNGDEADFFYVPVLDACLITRADDSPHLSMEEHRRLRSSFTLDFYKKAYEHIVDQYPYWNRSSGRDHIWSFSWDEGACYAPKEIWNSMMLVHWGNTNTRHNRSTTAYWADNWDEIPKEERGDHPCFDPDKDIVIPAWKRPDPDSLHSKLWARSLFERQTLFYFNGNLGPDYHNGRPEASYSMGIRQKVAAEFGSTPNKKGELGRQYSPDVIVTPERTDSYPEQLSRSTFCGVFPGDGWSGRMEDSILHGCIPVVIQDGIFLPYENVLNYESFAVRIPEDEIPNLIKILQAINKAEVEVKLQNVHKLWQRFLYRDSVLLEAERQKLGGHLSSWAVEFSKLVEDDAFSTFIQVLHYKLHNDPWREHLDVQGKGYGLPRGCLRRIN
ncbi:uncharacterized protein LOC116256114 isoform X1 [Nymphaea colorata]|nr:uncharacterized protein LOC116256114 isoform X1 [Nymphaea colorata]